MCYVIQKGCNFKIVECNHRKVWNRFIKEIMLNDGGNVVVVFMPDIVRKRLIKEFEERGETKNSLINLYPIRRVEHDDNVDKVWSIIQHSFGNKLIVWCDTVEALSNVLSFHNGKLITTDKMYNNFLKWVSNDHINCLGNIDILPPLENIKYLNINKYITEAIERY